MATGHFLTNRGKLKIVQGKWDSLGAAILKVGLLKAQGAAADTAVEVADFNVVSDLTASSAEVTVGGYARQSLTRSNWAEDDTNDRVNADAADVAFGALTAGETIFGLMVIDITTDTNDGTRELWSVDWFATTVPTNGGAFTYQIADLYRAA